MQFRSSKPGNVQFCVRLGFGAARFTTGAKEAFMLNPSPGAARVGIVTSRRVGEAVERNRVRRRLREIVRAERARLSPGMWLVIVARHRAVGVEFAELREEWLSLVRRAAASVPKS